MNEESCFIIAEAGSNHCGKLQLAYKLINVTSEARLGISQINQKLIKQRSKLYQYVK